MATHSSVLAWRIPGTGEPGGLPSMGSHRVRLKRRSSSSSLVMRGNCQVTGSRAILLASVSTLLFPFIISVLFDDPYIESLPLLRVLICLIHILPDSSLINHSLFFPNSSVCVWDSYAYLESVLTFKIFPGPSSNSQVRAVSSAF